MIYPWDLEICQNHCVLKTRRTYKDITFTPFLIFP